MEKDDNSKVATNEPWETVDATTDTDNSVSSEGESEDDGVVLQTTSDPFIGRWNQLVSTTNWEKGRIVMEWRSALSETGAPASEYSDDAWARRVGGVTGQHVGRLRRVYERFGGTYQEYQGLFWSHFHSAIDWDDAELWLEGAARSNWSVSNMRKRRWEAMGAIADQKPQDQDIVVADTDEDVEPAEQESAAKRDHEPATDPSGRPIPEGPDFGDEAPSDKQSDSASIYADDHPQKSVEFVRPFENLAELPSDLADAFEAFKLAILRHKAEDWDSISREDVLAALDALKELANAPSTDD